MIDLFYLLSFAKARALALVGPSAHLEGVP
nr:MAG TPA: hypothetical protein [Caudoviricetes sp.]